VESEIADDARGDTEVGCEFLGVGHVIAIGVSALGWEEAGGKQRRRRRRRRIGSCGRVEG